MKRHVFLSYVRENESVVHRLARDLESNGVNVWLDRNKIQPGTRWQVAIRRAIQSGDYFLACFSQEYAARVLRDDSYMNEELVLAIDQLRRFSTDRIWFIPVKLSECKIPDRAIGAGETLLDIQWIPLFEDWNKGVDAILNVIQPLPKELHVLVNALESNNEKIRATAAEELRKAKNARLLPVLTGCLEDKSHAVRAAAIHAMRELAVRESIPALIAAAEDEDNAEILWLIHWAFEVIGDQQAVPVLISSLKKPDPAMTSDALRALGAIGDRRAVAPIVDYLNKCNRETQSERRIDALNALSRIGDQGTAHIFVEAYESGDIKERMTAVECLGHIKDPAAKPTLLKALKHDEWYWVRVKAAVALYCLEEAEALPYMIEALGDESEFVRGKAAEILRGIPNVEAIGALACALKDSVPFVRRYAAEALGSIACQQAVAALEGALSDSEEFVKEAVRTALGRIQKQGQ